GQTETGAFPDFLGREERIEDSSFESGWNPGAAIGKRDLHASGGERTRNPNRLAWRLGHRIACVGQQVDEHLLELDRIPYDAWILGTQIQYDLHVTQPQLLLHEGQR